MLEHAAQIGIVWWAPVRAPRRLTDEALAELGEVVFVVDVELGVGVFAELVHVEGRTKRVVGQDVAPRFVAQLIGAAEVVEMRMRDHRGVDVAHFVSRGVEAGDERIPRLGAGQPRVDDRDAALVFEQIAIDVAETG